MSYRSMEHPAEILHYVAEAYSHDEERPLGGYLLLMGTFVSLFLGFLLLVRTRGLRLPEEFSIKDLLLLGVASYHSGRILSKAGVTSPLRAPFTEFHGPSDPPAEVMESVRPSGVRHAIGELVTCPFCIGLWLAAFLSYGLVLAPRITRLVSAIFVIDAVSDHLNLLYDASANLATSVPDLLQSKSTETGGDRHS